MQSSITTLYACLCLLGEELRGLHRGGGNGGLNNTQLNNWKKGGWEGINKVLRLGSRVFAKAHALVCK